MRILILLLFLLSKGVLLYSQDLKSDTTFLTSAISTTLGLYNSALQGQSNLYNGTGYPTYEALQPGEHPYFMVDDWSKGSIRYDGENYENVLLMYDLFRDKIVIEHYYNYELMELIDIKVDRFSLLGHTFIHLLEDKANNIEAGFYDSLYSGKIKVYAKYDKSMQKDVGAKKVTYFFSARTRYFIERNGIYFPVYSKSSVLDVFSDRKKALRQFLSRNRIGYNKDRGKAIAEMARFYDTLSANP